jgi:hypothetical protein
VTAVLRNNFVVKVMRPLPIHTRNATRRESVWHLHVKLTIYEQLTWKNVESVELHQECLVPKSATVWRATFTRRATSD